MMEPESLEIQASRERRIEDWRALGNKCLAEQSAASPGLAEFARLEGDEIAMTICRHLNADPATDPAMSTLRSAYTKLVFAFTNPLDYDDTLSDEKIVQNCKEIYDCSRLVPGGEPVPQDFAYYADLLATELLQLKVRMHEAGELTAPWGDYTADQQYDLVRERYETDGTLLLAGSEDGTFSGA
jgi:hypothetical protein